MTNPVDIADVQARFLRPLTDVEKTFGEVLLGDAWEELLVRVPDLEGRIAREQVSDGLVKRVVATMVTRVLRNPEAIRQWQIDDASFTRDQAVSAGFLFATADELSMLRGTPSPSEPVGHISLSASMGWGR